jgi:HSP20 family molecular chaperone IbpA
MPEFRPQRALFNSKYEFKLEPSKLPDNGIDDDTNEDYQDLNSGGQPILVSNLPLVPAIDVYETSTEFIIIAELPGLNQKNVSLEFIDNILTIRGEKKIKQKKSGDVYHVMERAIGSFVRSIYLPCLIDMEAVRASLREGLLKIALPKIEAVK